MHTLHASSWPEVREQWAKQENHDGWRQYYRLKGFRSWADWRWPVSTLLRLPRRDWVMHASDNAVEEASGMYCNALGTRRTFCRGWSESRFASLKDHPFFQSHPRVLDIRANFPDDTMFISLRHGGRDMLIEGHHRAVALAGMQKDGPLPRLRYAIAECTEAEFRKIFDPSFRLRAAGKILDVLGVVRSQLMLGEP